MTSDSFAQLDPALRDKLAACREILKDLRSTVVAFSAGVDSTFLLALAIDTLGADSVVAAMGVSASLAGRERAEGRKLADSLGCELVEVETGEIDDPQYAANPAERCFFCKSDLFTRLKALAEKLGMAAVLSGANADDTGDFRPGMRAGKELGVRSPLMEAGLTKADIRTASQAMGLSTWDKPAMACLASRVPYGQPITAEKLSRVERAEYALKDMGFAECRVRDHGTVARVEVPSNRITQAADRAADISRAIKAIGYTYVALDMEGFRSGSMNEVLDT